MLQVCDDIENSLETFTAPFLLLHGEDDIVTSPSMSKLLFDRSLSMDKDFKSLPGYWHSIIGGEPDENAERVYDFIFSWLDKRI